MKAYFVLFIYLTIISGFNAIQCPSCLDSNCTSDVDDNPKVTCDGDQHGCIDASWLDHNEVLREVAGCVSTVDPSECDPYIDSSDVDYFLFCEVWDPSGTRRIRIENI